MSREQRAKYRTLMKQHFITVCNHYDVNPDTINFNIRFDKANTHLLKTSGRYSKDRILLTVPDIPDIFSDDMIHKAKETIVHEMIHKCEGLHHDQHGYKLGYYSNVDRDTYTPVIYDDIFNDIINQE